MTDKPRPVATPTIKKKGKDIDMTSTAPTTGNTRFKFLDGSTYEGEWKLIPDPSITTPPLTNDKKETAINPSTKRVRHGHGTFNHPNGTTYIGNWTDDRMEGQGTLSFSFETNGVCQAKYVGEFLNNQYHGKGRFEWPDGSHYTGDWSNGQMEGQGELVICEITENTNSNELHRFVGTFHADQFVNETGQWIAPHVPLHYA